MSGPYIGTQNSAMTGTASGAAPDCPICCEPHNLSGRRPCPCPYCGFAACRSCLERYLLEASAPEPHCMSEACRKEWTADHLDSVTTRAFREGPLRARHADLLLAHERTLLPAAQLVLEERRDALEARAAALDHSIEAVRLEQRALRAEAGAVGMAPGSAGAAQAAAQAAGLRRRADREREIGGQCIFEAAHARRARARTSAQASFPCPVVGCRGFLGVPLNDRRRCGTCGTVVCRTCHEAVAGGPEDGGGSGSPALHACDPNTASSIAALMRDCRPCPACHVLIHRISGCNQMWCTACHTAFNWATGEVDKGLVHNPHYYDFYRRNGGAPPRQLGDVPCGGIPRLADAVRRACLATGMTHDSPALGHLVDFHRILVHVQRVEIEGERGAGRRVAARPATPANNEDLRLSFLQQGISEDRFKQLLYLRARAQERARAIRQVFEMLVACGIDLLNNVGAIGDAPEVDARAAYALWCGEVRALRSFFNGAMEGVSRRYNLTTVLSWTEEGEVRRVVLGRKRKRGGPDAAPPPPPTLRAA